MARRLPDKVYLIIETAVDEIMEEMKYSKLRGNVKALIEREFRIALREKQQERVEKINDPI